MEVILGGPHAHHYSACVKRSGSSIKYSKRQDLLGCHYICTARARSRQHDDHNTRATKNVSDFVNIQAPLFLRGFGTIHPDWCAVWYAELPSGSSWRPFYTFFGSREPALSRNRMSTASCTCCNGVSNALQWTLSIPEAVATWRAISWSCPSHPSDTPPTPNPRPLVTPPGM
jgi:hypothetical protein